jgi:hypothetical protein
MLNLIVLKNRFGQGWIAACAFLSLVQDFKGKEAYIQHVQNHWIESTISGPLAVLALVWCITSAVYVHLQQEKR